MNRFPRLKRLSNSLIVENCVIKKKFAQYIVWYDIDMHLK